MLSYNEVLLRSKKIQWWHGGIDLAYGIETIGKTNPKNTLLPYIKLPVDLTGKHILDVGAWDGFISYECERRNAERILAIDTVAWHPELGMTPDLYTGKAGFNLIHELRNSKVESKEIEVLDINPLELGMFNIVFFLGVLYHMRHPLLSLEKVASVTKDLLIVETHTELNDLTFPAMRFFPKNELNNDYSNWFGPNIECVLTMLLDLNFKYIEWKYTVGQRAIFHAYREDPNKG